MSRRDQIADALGISPGDADTLRSLLTEYDVRDIAAVLAANLNGVPPTALDDLTDVATAGGTEGDVLTQQNDGSFALEAPSGGSQPVEPIAPDEVAGLALWFKADQIAGKNDGDPVSTWEDQSDNGFDATAEMGEEPVYTEDVQNGLPGLHFDSTVPQYFTLADAGGVWRDIPGATWIAVASADRTANVVAGSDAILWASDGNTGELIRASLFGYGAFLSVDDSTDGDNTTPAPQGGIITGWAITRPNGLNALGVSIDLSGEQTVGRTFQSWWTNVVLGAALGATGNTEDTDSANVCIGATTIEHEGFEGYICEIAVWPFAVTPEQLAGLVAYLTAKWAPLTP